MNDRQPIQQRKRLVSLIAIGVVLLAASAGIAWVWKPDNSYPTPTTKQLASATQKSSPNILDDSIPTPDELGLEFVETARKIGTRELIVDNDQTFFCNSPFYERRTKTDQILATT